MVSNHKQTGTNEAKRFFYKKWISEFSIKFCLRNNHQTFLPKKSK